MIDMVGTAVQLCLPAMAQVPSILECHTADSDMACRVHILHHII